MLQAPCLSSLVTIFFNSNADKCLLLIIVKDEVGIKIGEFKILNRDLNFKFDYKLALTTIYQT